MNKIDIVLQGSLNEYAFTTAELYAQLPFINSVIVSCWENDRCLPASISPKIQLLRNKDPENPGNYNRNRQIKSSLNGLLRCKSEFAVKMRNDQRFTLHDMNLMYKFYNDNKEAELKFTHGSMPRNNILVSSVYLAFPFHPRDHVFWGNTEDLIHLFDIPYDNETDSMDFNKYLRPETYIGAYYCAKFNDNIFNWITYKELYLTDNAVLKHQIMPISNELTPKVFKPFPKLHFDWYNHHSSERHYIVGEQEGYLEKFNGDFN